jgi:8-oxo-dGTP pyrophosphatase MutT (NUDIX family)
MKHRLISDEEIIIRLSKHPYPASSPKKYFNFLSGEPKMAAVLVPLLQKDRSKEWHLLFTHRTDTVADHKGQVSFPGGRMEESDTSPADTALREAHEEIGIQPSDVKIVGYLPGFHTVSNYWIVPVIGIIRWPFQVQLHVEEVSRLFTIPLSWLASPKKVEIRDRSLLLPKNQHRTLKVPFFQPYEGEILWGVSAEITLSLIESLELNKNREQL